MTTAAYVNDAADRLTRISDATSSTTLEYDDANQLIRAVNAATGQTIKTYEYDDLGNRISEQPVGGDPATQYRYNQANELTGVQRDGNPFGQPELDLSYGYDGDGLRADLLWDKNAGLPLVLADADALYITGPGGLPIAQRGFDGSTRYYHQDQLGSTRALTDATGTVTARRHYDPYGNPQGTVDTSSPFGYAGQYTDHARGLIYMRARWYDPKTGQFITADPIGHASGETNLYRYASGDPINRIDPHGLDAIDAIFGPGGYIDDVVPDPVSNAAAGYLDGWTEGQISNAFGIEEWCDAPGYRVGKAASNVSVRGVAKAGIRAVARQGRRRSSPVLESDPYSPESVARRQSQRRRDAGVNADPDTPLPDRRPGRDMGGHSADRTDAHPTGERNVGTEEHSRVAKGRGGRGPRER